MRTLLPVTSTIGLYPFLLVHFLTLPSFLYPFPAAVNADTEHCSHLVVCFLMTTKAVIFRVVLPSTTLLLSYVFVLLTTWLDSLLL